MGPNWNNISNTICALFIRCSIFDTFAKVTTAKYNDKKVAEAKNERKASSASTKQIEHYV
jgi:hypothetical protein